MPNKALFTLFVLLMLALSSCSNRASSVIEDTNCDPPCWLNITPGVTTRSEVYPLLQNTSWIKKDTITDSSRVNPNDSIRWQGKKTSLDISGSIYFDNNSVVELIENSPKEKSLHLDDIILKFGQPDQVLILSDRAERRIISITLLYPQKGYVFLSYYISGQFKMKETYIDVDMDILNVWYCDPSQIYRFLTSGQIHKLDKNKLNQSLQNWNGVGYYKIFERWP